MGITTDASLMSTASTLNDSCSTFDDDSKGPLLCRGRITDDEPGFEKLASPTTTAISLEITESVGDKSVAKSERTTESKLERLRTKNQILRKKGSQRIREARNSLSRSVATVDESHTTTEMANPPPYPPPSMLDEVEAVPIDANDTKPTDAKEFSDFLRRSNNVLDRLSAEMAMASNLLNQSVVDDGGSFNDALPKKTNDFSSNLCVQNFQTKIGRDEKSIKNEENSIHNISVGEDWDQTTISATLEDTPSSSARHSFQPSLQPSIKAPNLRQKSQSGLPPPEVVVKRVSPRAKGPTRIAHREADNSFTGSSTSFQPRSPLERHLRQRPPSMGGDCASMYNSNQKVEKLALENDYLKRQLELLESRHRDAQRQLLEQSHWRIEEEPHGTPEPSAHKSSRAAAYSFGRRKRKSERRQMTMLLVVAPFMIASTIYLYQSVHTASTNSVNLNSMVRDGVLNHQSYGKAHETVTPEESDETDSDDADWDEEFDEDIDEHTVVLLETSPENDNFESDGEAKSGKKKNRLQRWLSRIEVSTHNDPMGAWYEAHRRISIERQNSEL